MKSKNYATFNNHDGFMDIGHHTQGSEKVHQLLTDLMALNCRPEVPQEIKDEVNSYYFEEDGQ